MATRSLTYNARLARIRRRLRLLTWMVGATLAMSTTMLFKMFH